MRNKKGIAPLVIILAIAMGLLAIYLFLYIPIPAFKNLRALINYFIIITFWFVFQAFLIFGYIKLGELSVKGIKIIKNKILKWNLKIEQYVISKY